LPRPISISVTGAAYRGGGPVLRGPTTAAPPDVWRTSPGLMDLACEPAK